MTLLTRKHVCLSLAACLCLSLTTSAFADETPAPSSFTTTPAPSSIPSAEQVAGAPSNKISVTDVALSENGTVVGRVLTTNGTPVDGAQVVIRQGDQIFAKLFTDKQGQFSSQGMRAGIYTIATVQGSGLYRLWPENIAPPSAKTQALVMTQEPVMRAQFGGSALLDWTAIGIGAAGLTVGLITLDKVDDIDETTSSAAAAAAAANAVSP